MAQQVDGSGRYAEAVSPLNSPQPAPASISSKMIDNTPPIPVEHSQDNKFGANTQTYFSAPEVVEQYPPQYHHYGGPPPGSPPPQAMSPPPMGYDEKGNPVHHQYQDTHQQYNGNDAHHQNQAGGVAIAGATAPQKTDQRRILGIRRRIFWFIVIGLILLGIGVGVGVGVGVGLKAKNSSSNEVSTADPFCQSNPALCIGGVLDSKYYSTKGAFNGSGIALAGESWDTDSSNIFTLFYQHFTGEVRYKHYTTARTWLGGTSTDVVATDAKNGTALSAVAYKLNQVGYFHIFYVGKDGKMKQRTNTNTTNRWDEGPVTGLNLEVYDAPSVGMQACWKGGYYGDTDAKEFNKTDTVNPNYGMNLWFPSDDSSFRQFTWYAGQDSWAEVTNSAWKDKNVHAGVGCFSWQEGSTITYAMMQNKQNETEIWWKDTDTNVTSTEEHPINSWSNSTAGAIDGVYPTASMGYTSLFYTQLEDKSIKAFNISYEAGKTHSMNTEVLGSSGGTPAYGLGGTHLTCTAYEYVKNNVSQWNSLYVFYQTAGDDITVLTRNLNAGEWTIGPMKMED